MMYVSDHAYYGPPLRVAKPQPQSDRILLVPKGMRHGRIDDYNQGAVLVVRGTEAAPALHRNTNRFEITCTHRPVIRDVVYTRRFCRTAFDIKRPGIVGAAQGQIGCESSRLHTGYVARALQQRALKRGDLPMLADSIFVPVRILRRERKASSENSLGLKSPRDPPQRPKDLRHQACSRQQ